MVRRVRGGRRGAPRCAGIAAVDLTFVGAGLLVFSLDRVVPGRREVALMTVLRLIIGVLAQTDPGFGPLLDLRRQSALSWIPAILLVAMLAFAVAECLITGNVAAAAIFAVPAFMLFAVKRRVSAFA
jgi:hypothetical protein